MVYLVVGDSVIGWKNYIFRGGNYQQANRFVENKQIV